MPYRKRHDTLQSIPLALGLQEEPSPFQHSSLKPCHAAPYQH